MRLSLKPQSKHGLRLQEIKYFILLTTDSNCQIYQGLEKVTGDIKLGRKMVSECSLAPRLSIKIYFFEISSRSSERLG